MKRASRIDSAQWWSGWSRTVIEAKRCWGIKWRDGRWRCCGTCAMAGTMIKNNEYRIIASQKKIDKISDSEIIAVPCYCGC